MEPDDMFWGDRFSLVQDPFGHQWTIAAHRGRFARGGAEALEEWAAQMAGAQA